MKYNFDKIIDRKGTDSVKYDMLEPLFGKKDIFPMWVADMDFEVPELVKKAIIERAEHPIYGYTVRPERYNKAIANWLYKRHAWEVDHKAIDFSPGVVPALVMSVLAFTEPGEKVLVQTPVYFPFFSSIRNHNRDMINSPLILSDGNYHMDFDDLERKFHEGVKLMMLCHPHNPVGRSWKRDELEHLAELAIKYKVLVLSDEIHSDLLLFGNKHIPFASLGKEIAKQTITCVAPSKTFNLAGLHTSAVIIENSSLKRKYELMLDHIHVGGGNVFGFVALEAAYEGGEEWLSQLISYLEGNFLFMKEFIKERIPLVQVTPLEATYLAWLNFGAFDMDDKELMTFMVEEAKVAFVDGPRFGEGGEQFLRMNIATPRVLLEKVLLRIEAALRGRFPGKF